MAALPRITAVCERVVAPGSGRPECTPAQLRVLTALDPVDPVMVTELADYLGVTASTMSLNLRRLEGRGLVERARDPADRRVANVRITPAGVGVRERSGGLDPERIYTLLHRLSPEERGMAVRGLGALARAAATLRSTEEVGEG